MSEENDVNEEISPADKKFIRGDYGLPFTFWGGGFGGTFVLLSFIISLLNSVTNDTAAYIFMVVFFCYSVFISVAIWRSSNQYKGQVHWAVLAKIAVILLSSLIFCIYFYLLAYLTADYPNH